MHGRSMNNSQLHHQMNANHSSTRKLPNEILSFIFELVCAPTVSSNPPQGPRITLASVCSYWHDVVWNTPQLWRTLSATVEDHTLRKTASTLQMFADNHRAPSSISLTFKLFEEGIEELLQPLEALLSQETAPCIRCVSLCGLSIDSMAVVALINERCCNIEKLYLSEGLPSLPSLSSKRKFKIPTCWSTLTTLRLQYIPLDIWFDLLFGCPQLIELACDMPDKPINNLTQPPSHQAQVMRFPHLEKLSLDARRQSGRQVWIDNFLQFYRFPGLKMLHWALEPYSYSLEVFSRFLSALPQCCDTLHFVIPPPPICFDPDQPIPEQCMETTISHVGKIKRLILSSRRRSPFVLMMQMLEDSAFLPSLTSFQYIRIFRMYYPSDGLRIHDIYEMLKSRKDTGVKSFSLRVPGWGFEFVDWEVQREKLSRLVNDGSFKFEIICGSEKLDI